MPPAFVERRPPAIAIDDQAATRVVRKESATVGDATAGQKNAGDGRSEKRPQQPWIGHRDIDGLHGGNALSRWKGGQGLHDENRKREKDSSSQPAAECGHESQCEAQVVDHITFFIASSAAGNSLYGVISPGSLLMPSRSPASKLAGSQWDNRTPDEYSV
jgi:hypothetical protein